VLKEIIEYHMSKLQKRLDIFTILINTDNKNENKKEKKGKGGEIN
jgi:hypothetical protein